MTIKNQKQQMMVKDGGSTSPDTEIVKPVRQAPESREAAIYKPRNGILRNLTTEKAATSQPDKQAAIQKQLLRQAEQGSGYTSPPAELGAQSKELHSALTSQVLPLAIKRVEATAAGLGAEKARRKYEARTWYMEQLLQAYRKEPSEQIAALYNKAYDAVGQDYYAYLRSRVAQKAAVEDYQSVERAYQGALTAYQDYIRREQQRYDQWRGAIRDPETVKPELDAVRSELTALQQADALGALGHNAGAAMQVYNNDLALQWEPYQGNAARIAQLTAIRDALQEEYDYGQYYRYESLRQNPDFEERSKYVSTANGKEEFNALAGMHTNTGFDDIYYDYINRNEDARNRQNLRDIQSNAAFLGIDKSYLEQMTDDEIALFNYVYATQGQEAAYDYVKYLTKGLNQRQRAELEEYWASYARTHPFASSVFSVLESPLKGLGYIGQTADYLTKGAIDENAGYNRFSHINSAIRGAVSRKLEESGAWGKVGSFAYQTGMSMGDFLFNTAITGGNQALSLAIMGTGAAADATIEAKDRGLEDWQAYTLGTVAGLAEVITEKVSLETLLNPDLLKNGALQYIVKNMLAEGSEEVGSDLINLFADILVSQDKSEWMDSVRAYRAEGRTDQEAFGLAFRDQALAMGLDFLGGAISGGIMAGGGAAAYNRYTGKLGAELGKQGLSQEDKMAFIQEGLQSDPDTASYQIAQRLEAQIEAGKEISDTDLARLWQANDQAIQQERLDDQNQAAAQEERTAAQETELRGLELPAVESDPLTAQDAPRNNELTAENDITLPGGTPLSVAEQLRRINDGIGGIENEPTQGYEQSGADIADAPGGTGNRISDGGPQRNAGAGAGKQAGGVGGGAIREERWRFEHTKAADQRNHSARNIRRISSQELGLRSGTEQRSIKAMPEEIWDGEMRQTADRIYQETGRPVTYVLGKLQVRYGSGRLGRVRGVFTGNGIIVQADNVEATVTQIADHEAFHAKIADEGQWITREIRRRIIGRYSEAEFSRVLDDYLDKLDGAIDMRGAREGAEYEARAMEVMEEVFADAYAGINAFGAHAERWTEEVNQFMDEHHMGKLQNQENGTARPTGPPAESFSVDSSEDSIKKQLALAQNELSGMDPVANITIPNGYMSLNKAEKQNWVIKKLQSTGFVVDRKGLGIIEFAKKRLKSAFNYFAKGSAEEAVFEALPYVLREGVQISSHSDHKNRSYGTITLAAPITVNGKRGNMAAVIKKTTGNYYKVHRVLTPEGSTFLLSERTEEAGLTPGGGVADTGPLATPISPASYESIADGRKNVNRENTVAARERSFEEEYGLKLPSLEDDDETAQNAGALAERYSIGRTTDNRPFVNVEEDILAGVPQSEWVKKVKENLKEKFPNGITVGNNEIYIDRQSRRELTYSNSTQKLYKQNRSIYADKLRATNNADEVLLAADNWVNEGQKHLRSDHIRDFARGTVLLRIGANDYTAEVVVATENSGKMKLYDILRMKKTGFAEREMDAAYTENPFPGADRRSASISEKSIADGGQNVNRENTVAARERSFEEEYGLKLPSLEDDDETAQNAGAQAERYSYGEQRPNYVDVEIQDAEVEEGVRAVTEMEPVTTIAGTEFSVGEKDLVTQVEEFFAQRGGIAFNPQLGDITLDRRGVKDDLSHGIGRKKAAAFAAVPEVLEYGRVIDYRNNWKGRGYDTAVIAAPIIIGTEENLMGVVVKRSNRTNRFYVHEVLTTKNEAMPFKTGTPKRGTPGGNAPSVISILDNLRTVKNENVQEPSFEEEYRLKLPSLEDEDGAPQNAETPGERYSIADIQGEAEDYGPGVVLDTNIFDGVKPRNWGAILSGFVYKNLAGAELTVFDEAGDPETIYLAKENERVRKNGGGNSHKVLDKLARYRGDNVAALATVHLSELLETSRYENTTDEHSHQWMDENGWEYRRAYMEDLDGSIYEATLNIANGRDRRILYAINNVRKIDRRAAHGVVPSTDTGRGSHIKSNSSESMITDESRAVKKKNFGERYSTDNSDTEQKKPARRKAAEPVAESKPIIAKRDLRNTMLNLFSIPAGRRAELGTVIDQYADRLIKNGALTEDDLRMFFDRMYASGVMTIEADAAFAEGRNYIREGRIYVPQSIRAEFGDDWSGLRRRAFGAGVYLTNNPADAGIDAWNADLAGTLPWLFDSEELDQGRILERIVQVAEEGRDEKVSLAEYTARLAEMEHTPEDEFLDNMERQMDWALRTFAEKANLELHLRDRTGKKIAQEREVFAARSREQRMREAQRRAEERENRKALARRQQEKKALSELQKKTLKQLQWLSKNRNRAPEELRAAFDEVLSDIDLFAVGAANEMRWSDKHNATWKDVVTLYDEMKREDENFFESAELERMATRLRGRKLEDLDVDALNDLYRLAVGVRTVYSNRNKMLQSEREQRIDEAYMDSVREIENATGGYKGNPVDKFLNLEQLTPINVIQRMGGWDPGGTFYSMGKQLEQGERNVRAFRVKANRMLQDFLTEHENWVKRADGQGKNAIWYEITVPKLLELRMGDRPIFGDTVTVYMTPAQKVHMYLESKSQDNLRHIAFGGRTFANKELYGQGKRKEAFAQGRTICLAPETVKTIVSDLTAEEMELAGILERYYNGLAHDEINKASNELYGYDKAIGRNYAPIYTNDSYTRKEIGVLDVTVEGQGPLQERQKHAGNASLNISCFDAFERNVEKISNFCGLAIPVRNWNALMNSIGQNKSMRDVIAHKWGGEANDYLTKMIKDIQGGETYEADIISTRMDKLMGNYISAVFGFNFSIVFKQLGSIPLASAYLGASNFPSVAQIARIDRGLISKYTQDLEWRTMGYSMPETKQLKDNPNWTQTNRITRFVFGGGAITAMDGWAASTLWPWAENKVRREFPDLEIGTQAQIEAGESPFYKKVAEEFENAVARSQSTSDFIHQSNLRKSKNTLAKAFTMFRSDSAQTYNALRQLIGEAQYYAKNGAADDVLRQAKKAAGTAVLSALVGYSWAELIELLMNLWKHKGKKYRDDDDELTAESVAQELAMGLVGDMAGVVTGGEELIDILGNIFTGEKWYGIDTPGMEQLNDVLEACMDAGKGVRDLVTDGADILKNGGDLGAYFRRHGNDILGGIKDFAGAVATYFPGLPVNNLEAYLLGIVKWASPELQTAYEDLMKTVDKSGLSGLEGDALAFRVGSILDNRRISREGTTAQALAELYEAGYKGAVPGDTPGSLSIDGESIELKPYQKQSYDVVWGQTVAGALDDLVTSEGFEDADPEAREKMLKDLYAYAAEQAKAALFDEYEIGSSAQKIQEMTGAGLPLAECMVWNARTSGMSSAEKSAELAAWNIPELEKLVIFRCKISDSRDDAISACKNAGVSFDQFLQAYSKYGEIGGMDLKANVKATQFSRWVNTQGFTQEQADVIKEELAYFNMTPASATRYDGFVEAGLSDQDAYDLTISLGELKPEARNSQVTELQKWRTVIDYASDADEQLAALATVMTADQYAKVEVASEFGVSPDAYVGLKEILPQYDADGNGAYKQTEIQAAIDAMDGEGYALTMEQKAVLWQIATGSSSAKNNPYSQRVGERVLDTKEDLTFQEEVERQLRGKG